MPNRNVSDEREKLDHSGHPTGHRVPGDLQAPSGGSSRPSESDDSRGGVAQKEPVTAPDSENRGTSARKNSRVRRLDSRNPSNQ